MERAGEDHGEAVVCAVLQGIEQVLYRLDDLEGHGLRRHDLLHLQAVQLLLRLVLQEGDVLELDDVHIVDAFFGDAVQRVARPARHHHREENGQGEAAPCGLHHDHGQRDRDARRPCKVGHCADERILTVVTGFLEGCAHCLPNEPAVAGASQQRGHKEATGHAQAVRQARELEVQDREDGQPAHVEVLALVDEVLHGLRARLPEELQGGR
mmetsp:Transcript_38134/g.106147  ORF Transcript_38134/g.106147 Transcript_38134/m.106147 type:complete len:211 (+) Transcript_38134:568-1200(+)